MSCFVLLTFYSTENANYIQGLSDHICSPLGTQACSKLLIRKKTKHGRGIYSDRKRVKKKLK